MDFKNHSCINLVPFGLQLNFFVQLCLLLEAIADCTFGSRNWFWTSCMLLFALSQVQKHANLILSGVNFDMQAFSHYLIADDIHTSNKNIVALHYMAWLNVPSHIKLTCCFLHSSQLGVVMDFKNHSCINLVPFGLQLNFFVQLYTKKKNSKKNFSKKKFKKKNSKKNFFVQLYTKPYQVDLPFLALCCSLHSSQLGVVMDFKNHSCINLVPFGLQLNFFVQLCLLLEAIADCTFRSRNWFWTSCMLLFALSQVQKHANLILSGVNFDMQAFSHYLIADDIHTSNKKT